MASRASGQLDWWLRARIASDEPSLVVGGCHPCLNRHSIPEDSVIRVTREPSYPQGSVVPCRVQCSNTLQNDTNMARQLRRALNALDGCFSTQ